ncbi:MAG: UDP-glucose 4-epimerase GalE [Geminicoccaceae bacterium]
MGQIAGELGSVLVTGGAGYIGSHAVLALRERGWPVVVLDDLSQGDAGNVVGGADLVVGDIADCGLVASLLDRCRVRAIMHFAGSISVTDSLTDPLAYYANNTAGSLSLLKSALAHGIDAFVFSSTAAVYGEVGAEPVPESAPAHPISPYGFSKLMTERMIEDAGRAHGLPFMVLRYFNVAGADPLARIGPLKLNATHLIKVALDVVLGKRPVMPLYGNDYPTPDGTAIRDFIHVSDLARLHVMAMERLLAGGPSRTLNCGYGRGWSVAQVLAAVERVADRPIPVSVQPRRPGDAAAVVADVTALKESLSWRPVHDDLEAMIGDALAWELRGHGARPLGESDRPAA